MERINSPMYGPVDLLDESDEEFKILSEMIHKYPVNAFGIVNKTLNKLGYGCCIDILKR